MAIELPVSTARAASVSATAPGPAEPARSPASHTGTATAAPAAPGAPSLVSSRGTPPGVAASVALARGAAAASAVPRPPEVVLTPPAERARRLLDGGAPQEALATLRAAAERAQLTDGERLVFVDALVSAGWEDVRGYRWQAAMRKANEALAARHATAGETSRGAHALLGEALYAVGNFRAALDEFTAALAESPADARLKRRVVRSRRHLQESASVAPEPAAEQ
jgi:hypothetical protein